MKTTEPDFTAKTIQVKLDVPDGDHSVLLETFRQFNEAVERVVDAGWGEDYKDHSNTSLHEKTYRDIKDDLDLTANLVTQARQRASQQIRRCVQDWSNDKKASKPEPNELASIAYDKRSMTISERSCSLSTVDGRKEYDYLLGDYQKRHLDDPNYECRSATLNYRREDNDFYLHVTLRTPTQFSQGNRVLGADLGIDNLAVTSTGTFFSGDDFSWNKHGYFRTRRSLQRKGTRSARRTLRQLSERENRYSQDYLHRVAKGIVREALEYDCNFIALENLENIRDRVPDWFPRQQRRLHEWAFRKLQSYIKYKAREEGVRIVTIDPSYTSQECSKCGHTAQDNRHGSSFHCQSCGYEVQADYNAAKNIGCKALSLPEGQSLSGLGNSQLALKSGLLNPSASTPYRSYDQVA